MLYLQTVSKKLHRFLTAIQEDTLFKELRLVGGTGLALQYGHRISVDLDFFGNLESESEEIAEWLSQLGQVKILKNSKNIKVFTVNDIKIDFVNYKYPWIDQPVEESGLIIASDKDIAAMKVAAIAGRGSKKDFVDLYFLLQNYTMAQIIDFYESKYSDASLFLALKSLTFFEDADEQPMPKMLKACQWQEVKALVSNEVKKVDV